MGLLLAVAVAGCKAWAGPPGKLLPAAVLHSHRQLSSPVENAAYVPAQDAGAAEPFSGTLKIDQSRMDTLLVNDTENHAHQGLAKGVFGEE